MSKLKEIAECKVSITMKPKENIVQSVFKDLCTLCIIGFGVYISRDNTGWTFITGGLFLFWGITKISRMINENTTLFDDKESAIKYLESIEE